ncbi:MAG: hypothetical protein J0I06_16220 [Planctomycetes bacterium]|nr:hypothetical protein [Planctomycetota bacterium]
MERDHNSIGTDTNPRRLVRCDACDRTVGCSATDLLRYTREGWPRCCGQVMALFTETGRPEADDTKVDQPALPSENAG